MISFVNSRTPVSRFFIFLVATIVALSLLVVGASPDAVAVAGTPLAQEDASPKVDDSDGDGIGDKPDLVSASLAARLNDERVEILGMRDEQSQTFVNPDGSMTREDFGEPVRVLDNGVWRDVDLDLTPNDDGSFSPGAAPLDVIVGGGTHEAARMVFEDGESLAVMWPEILPEPTVDGGVATFAVSDKADLLVVMLGTGLAARLRLNTMLEPGDAGEDIWWRFTEEGQVDFLFDLKAKKLTLSETDSGGVELKDGKTSLGQAESFVAWDSQVDYAGDPIERVELDASLDEGTQTKSTIEHELSVQAETDFLNDPNTEYPVIIDPDISSLGRTRDTWVRSGTTSNNGADYRVMVGRLEGSDNTNQTISYMMFDTAPIKSKKIISATLGLYQYEARSCSPRRMDIHAVSETWSSSMVYADRPSVRSNNSTYLTVTRGGAGCPTTNGFITHDMTPMVQAWASGTYANYGFRMQVPSANAKDASYERRFCSQNPDSSTNVCYTADRRPYLSVTYNSPPTIQGNPILTPAVTLDSKLYSLATPRIDVMINDAEAQQVRSFIQIKSGTTVVYEGYGSWVASGGTSTLTIPKSAGLHHGSSYVAYVWAEDGMERSIGSGTVTTFTVDSTPPESPLVVCSGIENGEWLDESTTQNSTTSCTASVPSGVKVEWFRNGVSQGDMTTGQGSQLTTSSFVFGSGSTNLIFVARDVVGNTATPVVYTFGIGGGGLSAPIDGESASASVPISATGRPGAIAARVEVREAGSATREWRTAGFVRDADTGAPWMYNVESSAGGSLTGDLVWDVGLDDTVTKPSIQEIRVCFLNNNNEIQCTPARKVSIVPHAFGGSYPTSGIGPGEVSLFTGEFAFSGVDVELPGFPDSLSLSRSYRSLGGAQTKAASVFGPGWVAGLTGPDVGFGDAEIIDRTGIDGSITFIDLDGEAYTYIHESGGASAQAVGMYLGDTETAPLGESVSITREGTELLLNLIEDETISTQWRYTGDNEWEVVKIRDSSVNATTRYSYTSQGLVSSIYAAPPVGVRCDSEVQEPGCRVLSFSYISINTKPRLSEVTARLYDPKPDVTTGLPTSTGEMISVVVAKYEYDSEGRLIAAWDPRVGAGSSALKTTYSYTQVGSRNMIASIGDPGLQPWQLNYDAKGRLSTIKRANPSSVGGTATWTVVYDVGNAGSGLPSLDATNMVTWGQQPVTVTGTAVFGPNLVPSNRPSSDQWSYASIAYFDAKGTRKNTASFGAGQWQISSFNHDTFGNEIWFLDEGSRAQALKAGESSISVANSLAVITSYSTDGRRAESVMGPTRPLVLANGTTVMGRDVSETVYEDEADASLMPGRPIPSPDDPPRDVIIEQVDYVTTGAGSIFDTYRTRYRYDPIQAGDGDGWELSTPTRVLAQKGTGWETTEIRHDKEGKLIASSGGGSAPTSTKYYTADASGGAECGNKPQWAGMQCVTQFSGSNATPLTKITGYDYMLNVTRLEEVGTNSTRVTTTEFDLAERELNTLTMVNGRGARDKALNRTIYEYSPTTGARVSTKSGDLTETMTYDSWGRIVTSSDSTGNTATTTYDPNGRVVSFFDGKGTYSYTYDGVDAAGLVERRGMVTKVNVGITSGPSEFTAAYDADGYPVTVKYPNQVIKQMTYNNGGLQTSLSYETSSGQQLLAFSADYDSDDRQRIAIGPSTIREYVYDDLDRLSTVKERSAEGCITRTYAFDTHSNRTSRSTAVSDDSSQCTTANAVVDTGTFDDADRIVNAGYTYDSLGRTLTMPAVHTDRKSTASGLPNVSGELKIGYFDNDMVAELTQTVVNNDGSGTWMRSNTYALDASERISSITAAVDGVALKKTMQHYAGEGDSPAWVTESNRFDASAPWVDSWVRFIAGIDGGFALSEKSDGSSVMHLTNMHGDVVAETSNTSTFEGLKNYSETDEFGLKDASGEGEPRYGWLGKAQRSTETVGGLVLMGARLYNPETGRFLTPDPKPGGNANAYIYPPDPVNNSDTTGEFSVKKLVKKVAKSVAKVAKKTAKVVTTVAKTTVKTVKKKATTVKKVVKKAAKKAVVGAKIIMAAASKGGGRIARGIKQIAKSTSAMTKTVLSKINQINDPFGKSLKSFGRKLNAIAVAQFVYAFARGRWTEGGGILLGITVGVFATAACTAATAGAAALGCFIVGAIAQEAVNEAFGLSD